MFGVLDVEEFEQLDGGVGDGRGSACIGRGIRCLALPLLLCLPPGHISCCRDPVCVYRVDVRVGKELDGGCGGRGHSVDPFYSQS